MDWVEERISGFEDKIEEELDHMSNEYEKYVRHHEKMKYLNFSHRIILSKWHKTLL